MRKPMVAALLLGGALWMPGAAAGTFAPVCCACLDASLTATTSQAAQPQVAAFCAESTVEHEDLVDRCVDVGPNFKLLCIANEPGPSCAKQFLDEHDIICPEVGAPVAGASGLATLVVALCGLGVWAVGRRMRQRA